MNNLIIATYNIREFNHPFTRKKIYNQLKKMRCSIALLQETRLLEGEHKKLQREWVSHVYYASFGKKEV